MEIKSGLKEGDTVSYTESQDFFGGMPFGNMGSGGMPSSHSAMTCAMLMMVGFTEGFSSSVFALAFCFSGVVMYDAAGVRRSTGKNAAVLNRLIDRLATDGTFDEEHLKELVGHTPIQVLAGALLGILVGTLMA